MDVLGPLCWFVRDPLRNLVPFALPQPLPTGFPNANTSGVASTLSNICVTRCVSGAGRGDFENPRRMPGAWGRKKC